MANDPHVLNRLTDKVLAAACRVHTAYEACLAHELRGRGLEVDRQRVLPVR